MVWEATAALLIGCYELQVTLHGHMTQSTILAISYVINSMFNSTFCLAISTDGISGPKYQNFTTFSFHVKLKLILVNVRAESKHGESIFLFQETPVFFLLIAGYILQSWALILFLGVGVLIIIQKKWISTLVFLVWLVFMHGRTRHRQFCHVLYYTLKKKSKNHLFSCVNK